jgi:menaquinone-dependent protoporphyrinogen IX oxidase
MFRRNIFKNSIPKTVCRQTFLKHFKLLPQKSHLTCLSLPSDALVLEKQLSVLPDSDVSLYGVEYDEKTYKRATKKALSNEIPIFLANQKDIDFLRRTQNKFDAAWLDYCGSLDVDKIEAIRILAQKRAHNRTLLGITVQNARETPCIQKFLKKMANVLTRRPKTLYEERILGIYSIVRQASQKFGASCAISKIYHYHSQDRHSWSAPMLFFLFTLQTGKPLSVYKNIEVTNIKGYAKYAKFHKQIITLERRDS